MLEFAGFLIFIYVANIIWETMRPICKRALVWWRLRRGIIRLKSCKYLDGVELIDGYTRQLEEGEKIAYGKLRVASNIDVFAIFEYGEDTKIRFTWSFNYAKTSIGNDRACLLSNSKASLNESSFLGEYPDSTFEFVQIIMSKDNPWVFGLKLRSDSPNQ